MSLWKNTIAIILLVVALGSPNAFSQLIGASCTPTNIPQNNPELRDNRLLSAAILCRNDSLVERLMMSPYLDVRGSRAAGNFVPQAAKVCSPTIVKMLLDAGTPIQTPPSYLDPIHYLIDGRLITYGKKLFEDCSDYDVEETARLLLEAGDDPFAKGFFCFSPTSNSRQLQIVFKLMSTVNPNQYPYLYPNFVSYSTEAYCADLLEALASDPQFPPDVNATDRGGHTAMWHTYFVRRSLVQRGNNLSGCVPLSSVRNNDVVAAKLRIRATLLRLGWSEIDPPPARGTLC